MTPIFAFACKTAKMEEYSKKKKPGNLLAEITGYVFGVVSCWIHFLEQQRTSPSFETDGRRTS